LHEPRLPRALGLLALKLIAGTCRQQRPCFHTRCLATLLGLARTIYVYEVYTVFLAGKPPSIRSYTVYVYGSGRP